MDEFIPAEESFQRWKKDPEFAAAYEALTGEFMSASAAIQARVEAEARARAKDRQQRLPAGPLTGARP
jgi:hypothetical protein